MNQKTSLERAFELADKGLTIREIREGLQREGYDWHQLYGTTIVSQLGKRITAARKRGSA
jgi:hypothetical protein